MLKATILRQTSNSLLYRSTHANIDQPSDMPLRVEFNKRMTEALKRGNWVLDIPSLHTHTHTHNLTWLVRTWRLCDCSLRLGTLHPSHPFSTGSSVSLQGECSRCEAKQNTRHQASAEISKTFPTKKEKHKLTAQMFTLVLANTMGLSKNC